MFQFTIDQHDYPKVHFIGIGGVSMSGIAELLYDKGYEVTGSDRSENLHVKHLQKRGISISIGQKKENIADQDLFVYTDAIPSTNEEWQAALATGKPLISRGEFLGALMRNYKNSIAVSGSHGKSTTTSIITKILLDSQAEPTILLGGSLDEISGNVHVGASDIFLAEACEFNGNIRYYYPEIAIVLNIEADHLEYYRNVENIIQAFSRYMQNMGKNSHSIINIDDANSRMLLPSIPGTPVTFGINDVTAQYRASSITFDAFGHPSFQLHYPDGEVQEISLGIIGRYNIYNMLAAAAACDIISIDRNHIKKGMEAYRPLHRRMEIIGSFQEATVMTDYGHHPTEISATLEALAEHKAGNLICVFQPFTYSRTRMLMKEFSEAFDSADEVVITKILGAREVDDGSVKSEELVEKLLEKGIQAVYCETFQEAERYLATRAHRNDIILTTGCGNIDELAYQMTGMVDTSI